MLHFGPTTTRKSRERSLLSILTGVGLFSLVTLAWNGRQGMVVLSNTNNHLYSDVDFNSYVETYFNSAHFIGPSSVWRTLKVPRQFGVL